MRKDFKRKFFSLLFPESNGLIEIREIEEGKVPQKRFFNNIDKVMEYKFPKNKNIYFGLYSRGFERKNGQIFGGKSNCKYTNAICLDFDNISSEEINNALEKEKIPKPSIVVSSGHGFHYYWVLKNKYADLTNIVKQMANVTGADPISKDKARLFRLPGTNNIKEAETKNCKIIHINSRKYEITKFKKLFPTKIETKVKKNYSNVIDYNGIGITRYCVKEMLNGVPNGFRHFCLGRLVKIFQRKGYPQIKVRQTMLDWNQRNVPPLKEKDILDSFYKYWKENYNLFGCKIKNLELQAKLSKFCIKSKCEMSYVGTKLDFSKSFGLNNRMFNNFGKVSGYEIIIYGIFSRHSEELTTTQIKSKLINNNTDKPCIGRTNRRKTLNKLKAKGFLEVIPGNRKAGKENFYRIKKQGTFGLGYTVLTNESINGAIDGRITSKQLKIYALLCKYGWSKISFPSLLTLSKDTGIGPSIISKHIKALEKADYLKRDYIINQKGVKKLTCRLLV